MLPKDQILALLQSEDPDEAREGAYLAGKERLLEAVGPLAKLVSSPNMGVQEAAERALEKIGGVPVLEAMLPLLRSDDSPVRNIAMDLLRKVSSSDVQAICAQLQDSDPDVRIFISDILGSSGSLMAVAPLCAAMLRDPEVNVRYQAAISLGSLGFQEAEKCLVQGLKDEEWVQFAVIDALARLRSEGSVVALTKALATSSDLVASMIVEALGVMGNIKSVPLLIKHLNNSPSALCNKIVKAVVNILSGPSISLLGRQEGERLRAYMLNALNDEDVEVQDAAISGLAYLGGSDAFAGIFSIAAGLVPERDTERLSAIVHKLASIGYDPVLEKAMTSGNEQTMFIAIAVLNALQDERAVKLMKESFEHCPRDVQRAIINSLAGKCGPDDQDFFLEVANNCTDGTILKAALRFLGHSADPAVAAPVIIHALEHQYIDVKKVALEACLELRLPEINTHFRKMYERPEMINRVMSIYGMGHYSVDENEDLLLSALGDHEPDVRKMAIEALASSCPLPEHRVSRIRPALNDEQREVRLSAIDALGMCPDETMRDYLKNCLKDPDPLVRGRCMENLARHITEESFPLIVDMLYDENQFVVIKAVEVLAGLGGELAFRALLPLIDHPEPDIQRVVEEAIAKIREEAGV